MILRVSSPIAILIATATMSAPMKTGEVADVSLTSHKAILANEQVAKNNAHQKPLPLLSHDFANGERTSQEIQTELTDYAGDGAPIQWSTKSIKTKYILTQILTHVQNLENNFELLHVHTLQNPNTPEHQVTRFTQKIQEADEQNIKSQILISRIIEIHNNKPIFSEDHQVNYQFFLKKDKLHGTFHLREPVGDYTLVEATATSFDPVGLLTNVHGSFGEIGEYQYELPFEGKMYNVTLTPRLTDIETLTIEVEIREIESLTTTTFVLIYEQAE